MSFEGTYQILCENGHYNERDVYDFSKNNYKCSICGAKADWVNLIDQTNVEECGRVELKKVGEDLLPCVCCAGSGSNFIAKYEIPKNV